MNVTQNLGRGGLARRTGLLLPVVLLPLGLMGVTVRPALDVRETGSEEIRLRALVEHCQERRRVLDDFGDLAQLEVLEELRQKLRALLPGELEPIAVYSHLRNAARSAGFELQSIRATGKRDLGLAIEGSTVVMQTAVVVGDGRVDSAVNLVDALEQGGYPAAMLRLRMHREHSDTPRFHFELELGLFHYAPANNLESTSDEGL